jgi:hypothetical protein
MPLVWSDLLLANPCNLNKIREWLPEKWRIRKGLVRLLSDLEFEIVVRGVFLEHETTREILEDCR